MAEQRKKVSLPVLFDKMTKGTPLTMITCYDYPMAYLVEQAGIDIVLVGDSLGMTILGFDSTLPVTMDDMIRHAQAVRRGTPNGWLIGDMPYMSYQASDESAVLNAGRFMAEAACDGIKLEGGMEVCSRVRAIVAAGIPVMGHLGLTPQSVSSPGRLPPAGQERQAGQEDRRRREGARRGRRDGDPARAGARPGVRAHHRARRRCRSSAWAAARTRTASC